MRPSKPATPWGILRLIFAGVLAAAAAVEWGGAGPSKLIVGLLTFAIVYGLLSTWKPRS